MKILITSAAKLENRLVNGLNFNGGKPVRVSGPFNHELDALVTGVGAVPTAFSLTRFVEQYQLIVNIGIAGSYRSDLPVGAVVCVKEDLFGDYGIDDNGIFKSLAEMNLLDKEAQFSEDVMVNPWIDNEFPKLNLPLVKGVTLSTVSGSKDRIERIRTHWNVDIETMENASTFYVCRMLGVKFVCIRAISNMVEPRNKKGWNIDKAISNLNDELTLFIKKIP